MERFSVGGIAGVVAGPIVSVSDCVFVGFIVDLISYGIVGFIAISIVVMVISLIGCMIVFLIPDFILGVAFEIVDGLTAFGIDG